MSQQFSYLDGVYTVQVTVTRHPDERVTVLETGLAWPGLRRITDLPSGEVWFYHNGRGDGPIGRWEKTELVASSIGGKTLEEMATVV